MRAKRIDDNQNQIVKAFRDRGCTVLVMSMVGKGAPDIAVGIEGRNWFFEIKDGEKFLSQQKLTKHEKEWHDNWKGQVDVISSIEDIDSFFRWIIESDH